MILKSLLEERRMKMVSYWGCSPMHRAAMFLIIELRLYMEMTDSL